MQSLVKTAVTFGAVLSMKSLKFVVGMYVYGVESACERRGA